MTSSLEGNILTNFVHGEACLSDSKSTSLGGKLALQENALLLFGRMANPEPAILLEETNPYQTRVAQLESDGRTIYLYLGPPEDLPGATHAVWVRNLLPAPEASDRDAMKEGRAPLQKRSACRHPQGSPLLSADDLDLVWFPEGTGVSLYYKGQVEAVIPPYAGLDDIQGYAREAKDLDLMTLPLPEEGSGFYKRLEANLAFWSLRSKPGTWPKFRDALLAHYESILGKHLQYYALERDYPPMAIVEFPYNTETAAGGLFPEGDRIFASLGMSYQPMPGLEAAKMDVATTSRMEFISPGLSDHKQLPGLLGRMAVYPWLSGGFFADGHLYESGMDYEKSDYLFTKNPSFLGFQAFPDFSLEILEEPGQIQWLCAIPVTHEDMLLARTKGVDFALKKL